MYAWIWRKLPFGLHGKIAGSLILAGMVTTLLWFVVFPWIEPFVSPWDDVQVEDPAGDFGDLPASEDPSDYDVPYPTDEPSSAPNPTPSRRR